MAHDCEFEYMEYIDEDSIDGNLICPICHKPFKEPVYTSCDHTYGDLCIKEWIQKNEQATCPTCCKKPLLINELKPVSRLLRNMLDQLRVQCTLCEERNLVRGTFPDHMIKVCPKAIIGCAASDIKCPWKGPRDQLQNHLLTCIFEPLRPVLALLINQVKEHDNEIKELTAKISQLTNAANESSDASDSEKEHTIFITNLPGTIRFNEFFDLFSKIGRIKYDPIAQKTDAYTFKSPNKDGTRMANVTYVDKESVTKAIAEYNNKLIPIWNTRIHVQISKPKPKQLQSPVIGKNPVHQDAEVNLARGPATNKAMQQPAPMESQQTIAKCATPAAPLPPRRRRKKKGGIEATNSDDEQ